MLDHPTGFKEAYVGDAKYLVDHMIGARRFVKVANVKTACQSIVLDT
jgi:hypothetical protein